MKESPRLFCRMSCVGLICLAARGGFQDRSARVAVAKCAAVAFVFWLVLYIYRMCTLH